MAGETGHMAEVPGHHHPEDPDNEYRCQEGLDELGGDGNPYFLFQLAVGTFQRGCHGQLTQLGFPGAIVADLEAVFPGGGVAIGVSPITSSESG